MSDLGLHAWVDESIHVDMAPSGMYVLAATIGEVDPGIDQKREVLRSLVVGPQPRLHWHAELASTRARVVETIAGLGLEHRVVVRMGVDPSRQERARRKCLERLLFELSERRVSRVWLESRTERLNRRDVKLVDAARNMGAVAKLAVEFARPLDEPMLWVPDAVAGVVAFARKGRDHGYRARIASSLQEIEI